MKNTSHPDDELNPEIFKQFKSMLGGRIRLILTGSAMVTDKVLKFYRFGLGYQVINIYGQTECGPVTMNVINVLNEQSIGNVGVPLPNVNIKLVDAPEMDYFSKNNEGEICVKGHTNFKYYLKNPQKTAETIDAEGWIHTGDIGKFLPDGSLKIVDRMTNIFKITNGFYITPEKIEAIYSRSQYALQVFIYGGSMRDYLVSIVVPDKKVVLSWVKEVLKCEMTWCEACKHPELKELILNDMCRLGNEAGLFSFEQARSVYLHAEPLTYKTGHLTASLKTKRAACRDFFKREIEAMYEETDNMIDL